MGIMNFIKEAGERLFGRDEVADPAAQQATIDAANHKAGAAIETYIATQHLSAEGLRVAFDGATRTATVTGHAADQATREKIALCCGNVQGVAQVDDQMTVAQPAPAARFHTVVRGDTLSAIAKTYYGNATRYQKIFEANQPMLRHVDLIYPGQVLRIPD